MAENIPPRVLTIAGSDSGGGAGIEADLKTFTTLQVFGMAAVTSITAQNTVGVHGVHDVPSAMVAQQIDVVAQDIGVDAAKSGMLSNAAIIEAVADALARNEIKNYVLDPVMISETGHRLLREDAVEALKTKLIPLCRVITPNTAEAAALTGIEVTDAESQKEAARRIYDLGANTVLVKGGHMRGPRATDLLYDGRYFVEYSDERIDTRNTHGTGCTYAAAIAAFLGHQQMLPEAIRIAKQYVTECIRRGFALGHGAGPLNHFWPMQQQVKESQSKQAQ
jgi:hydroxymethylpyrimidine kinase/phosphomethylpyrimidine kinase